MAQKVVALKNETESQQPPAEQSVDENGLTQPEEPLTIYNAGDRLAQYPSTLIPNSMRATADEAQANDLAIAQAKLKAEMFALPKAETVKKYFPPSALYDWATKKQQETVRQPIQMQREFSNEEEKQAYLERLRKAMAAAAKK